MVVTLGFFRDPLPLAIPNFSPRLPSLLEQLMYTSQHLQKKRVSICHLFPFSGKLFPSSRMAWTYDTVIRYRTRLSPTVAEYWLICLCRSFMDAATWEKLWFSVKSWWIARISQASVMKELLLSTALPKKWDLVEDDENTYWPFLAYKKKKRATWRITIHQEPTKRSPSNRYSSRQVILSTSLASSCSRYS